VIRLISTLLSRGTPSSIMPNTHEALRTASNRFSEAIEQYAADVFAVLNLGDKASPEALAEALAKARASQASATDALDTRRKASTSYIRATTKYLAHARASQASANHDLKSCNHSLARIQAKQDCAKDPADL
jgi:hypothetical protein